jgi:hypothetical protein
MNAAGKLLGGRTQGGIYPLLTSPTAFNDGDVHLAIYTCGAAGSALYVDGTKVAGSTTASASYGDQQFRLGANSGTSYDYFVGRIGAAFWYSTALSDDELTLLTNQLKAQWGI